jgi:hypothetical protein
LRFAPALLLDAALLDAALLDAALLDADIALNFFDAVPSRFSISSVGEEMCLRY